jgi:hypothetical protein
MLGLFFFSSFLLLPLAAAISAMGNTDRFVSILSFVGAWPQILWIIAVCIKLQRWNHRHTPSLIWAGVWVLIAASFFIPSDALPGAQNPSGHSLLAAAALWFFIAAVCLSWQIASVVTKGFVDTILCTFAVLCWPFFLSFFNNRLRTQLEAVQRNRPFFEY